jgi:type IV pilus assembly protein PilZ
MELREGVEPQLGLDHRRRDRRLPILIKVEYLRMDDFLVDYASNISLGGMFILTEQPLELGTQFRIRFVVPGWADAIETRAEVRWRRSPGPGPLRAGMGVRFDGLAPNEKARIEALISQLDGR